MIYENTCEKQSFLLSMHIIFARCYRNCASFFVITKEIRNSFANIC